MILHVLQTNSDRQHVNHVLALNQHFNKNEEMFVKHQ
jgi:hypothetical protein